MSLLHLVKCTIACRHKQIQSDSLWLVSWCLGPHNHTSDVGLGALDAHTLHVSHSHPTFDFFFLFVVLGIESAASYMLHTCPISKLQPPKNYLPLTIDILPVGLSFYIHSYVWIYLSCVCSCVCVVSLYTMCMSVYSPMCACAEARSWCQVSFLYSSPYCWDRVSQWSWQIQPDHLASTSQDTHVSDTAAWGVTDTHHHGYVCFVLV